MKITLDSLLFTAVCLLIGTENIDFTYYETDPYWWAVRLWTRRN